MPVDAAWGRAQVFRPFPSCPGIVFARAAARSDGFGPTDASGGAPVVVGSAAGADEGDVALRARSELVERVSNILAGRAAEREAALVTSFDELRRSGAPALDPAAWRAPLNVGPSGPSGSVGAADGRRATMLWVSGRSLVEEREVMVPAGAAFLRHRPPPGCPTVVRAGSAGVAAHATRGQAVEHALLEVLERDLAARSWFGTGPVCVANPPTRWPSPLDSGLEVLGLEASTLALPGPSGSACLVTCLHSGARRQQSFGARCVVGDDDGRWSAGFERAAYEALMVRWSMATPVARRAWDDMRARDDPTLPGNALEHALWTFHVQDSLGHWLSQAVDHGIGTPAEEDDLASAVAAHTGEDVVVVDSTVAFAGAGDGVVVRVVAPGAERLLGEAGHGSLPHPFG